MIMKTKIHISVCTTQIWNKKSLKIPKGGNQNPYIEEEQKTQWPKEKAHKNKKSLKIPKGGNQNPYIEEEQKTQWPKEKAHKNKKSLKIPKG
jgi:hypothetical protein